MARLVLLACLMLSAVSVSAAHNWLDVEHCSEDCGGACGEKTRYITGKCVDNEGAAPGGYKATCTPGGAWKIEDYAEKGCTGTPIPLLNSEQTCSPFSDFLPVKYVSYDLDAHEVTVKICGKVSRTSDAGNCDVAECKEKKLSATGNCAKITEPGYFYTAVVNDGATALTLGLYGNEKLCKARVAPLFYKENMAKDGCATYKPAFKGTCTPMTRTHTVPTTSTSTQGTTDSSTSANTDGSSDNSSSNGSNNSDNDNDTDGNNTSSAVSSSLAAALLAVLAVLVALY